MNVITLQGKPNPGSFEAFKAGCTCPVVDNAHGEGITGRPGEFIVTDLCPMHTTEGAELKQVEQGFGVWMFYTGGRVWVAARNEPDAFDHLVEKRLTNLSTDRGERVLNLDEGGFCYGDVEEGDELEPCTLRDLLKMELEAGTEPPVILAEDE